MKVEAIIATFDRRTSLLRTLEGLRRQSEPELSIAVIDDCSSDPVDTWLDLDGFGVPVRLLRTAKNSGPAHARNLGVASSTADVVLFIDDDVVPDHNLVRSHMRVLETGGAATVSIGPLRAPADWKPTPWNRWEASTLDVEYQRMARGVYRATWRQFFTGNAALWRNDFLAVGGFDETFKRAEDIEFAYRMSRAGVRFEFEPRAIGWHYAKRSLSSWRKIPGQYAAFDAAIARLHPELNWKDRIDQEQRQRHRLTREVERAVVAIGGERPTATAAIASARIFHACGVPWASNRLLSLAFQLEYGATARRLSGRQRFNPPSTASS